jgi:hypothetical protein
MALLIHFQVLRPRSPGERRDPLQVSRLSVACRPAYQAMVAVRKDGTWLPGGSIFLTSVLAGTVRVCALQLEGVNSQIPQQREIAATGP